MTISAGLLLAVMLYIAHKADGIQWPFLIAGAVLIKVVPPGSFVDDLGTSAAELYTTMVTAVLDAVGQGNLI